MNKWQEQLVRKLDELNEDGNHDPDVIHGKADDLLLDACGPEVRAAYKRLIDRSNWWATA